MRDESLAVSRDHGRLEACSRPAARRRPRRGTARRRGPGMPGTARCTALRVANREWTSFRLQVHVTAGAAALTLACQCGTAGERARLLRAHPTLALPSESPVSTLLPVTVRPCRRSDLIGPQAAQLPVATQAGKRKVSESVDFNLKFPFQVPRLGELPVPPASF
jgi:hypothetical protein